MFARRISKRQDVLVVSIRLQIHGVENNAMDGIEVPRWLGKVCEDQPWASVEKVLWSEPSMMVDSEIVLHM